MALFRAERRTGVENGNLVRIGNLSLGKVRMTERLYYADSYLKEFDAEPVNLLEEGGKFWVQLDRTAFYPTSGGQMHDTGRLNDVRVTDVIEKEDVILHEVAEKITGTHLKGKIDWERRFDFMQQHTGFHLLAGAFLHQLRLETLSSHLGEDISTIDIGAASVSGTDIHRAEDLANQIIAENRPVRAAFADPKNLPELPLRKIPPVKTKIRLVEIQDFDLDPCGGTHVRHTGEVQLVKIVRWEKVRGYLRLYFYAGKRAVRHYRNLWGLTRDLNLELSAGEDEILTRVRDFKSVLKVQKKEIQQLKEFWIDLEAKRLTDTAGEKGLDFCLHLYEDIDPADARQVAQKIVRETNLSAAIFIKSEKSWRLILAHPEKDTIDFRDWLDDIRVIRPVKGGGRPSWVEVLGEGSPEEVLKRVTAKFNENG